jgi:hypothetical protein
MILIVKNSARHTKFLIETIGSEKARPSLSSNSDSGLIIY